ncbi:MAG: HIT domain-containing protein [Omnitrophica bacterium]|nr:HIT domain-containing protein [Candidatus Omnitrophota bacterium]
MERIWAPWRKSYVTRTKPRGCIFCSALKAKGTGKKRYVLKRNRHAFSMLNLYPYNNAHVMVAPARHVKSLEFLSEEELSALMALVNHTKKKIDRLLKPAGYNIGLNVGRVAGAGFPGHVHMHIVPRWQGDSNFMPAICDAKVISHSLDEMWESLKG